MRQRNEFSQKKKAFAGVTQTDNIGRETINKYYNVLCCC